MSRRIAWIFPLGHGHAAQYQNFRECCPEELEERSVWVGMDFFKSDDWLANSVWLPERLLRARHEMWHFKSKLGSSIRPNDALFIASWNLRFVPYMLRYPSYFYVDFSPSGMRSLSPWYDHFYRKSKLAQGFREFVASGFPHSARAVFAMSRWCADGICKDYRIERDRVHVVPGGVNLDKWRYIDRSEHSGVTRILMVGGEFQRKGGEILLKWAATAQDSPVEIDIVTWPGQLPARVLELLGNPKGFDRVSKDLGPWLPKVRVHCGITPNTPDLQNLFQKADIFCLPTQADFSPIAGLEAMASGLPVVLGEVGAIPECVEHGTTGFLVKPGSVESLGSSLDALIRDKPLRLAVGRNARRMCETRFNIRRQMTEIARIIDADLDRPDPRGRIASGLSRVLAARG